MSHTANVSAKVRLRVPRGQVQDVAAALRSWFVEVRIRLRERTEQFAVLAFEVQPKRGVERVAGFVPQDAHTLLVRPTLDFEHLTPFEPH